MNRQGSQNRHEIWIMAASLTGASLAILSFYPGYMSYDSLAQLAQARLGIYHDWHPPLMGWIWGILDRGIPGPAGMLLLHNAIFWAGLGLTVHLVAPGRFFAADRIFDSCLACTRLQVDSRQTKQVAHIIDRRVVHLQRGARLRHIPGGAVG